MTKDQKILLKPLLKLIGNAKSTVNLNDPSYLEGFTGLGAFIMGVGALSFPCIDVKRKWYKCGACFVGSIACGLTYKYMHSQKRKDTEAEQKHHENIARIRHPGSKSMEESGTKIGNIKIPKFNEDKLTHKRPSMYPPVLREIIENAPVRFETPFFMSAVAMLASYCFSRVRAKRDNKLQAPNLQVCCKSERGSGKSKIGDLHRIFFGRIIEREDSGDKDVIVQTSGINISEVQFIDTLECLKQAHLFVLETEVNTVTQVMRPNSCISYDTIRKAFDNDYISKDSRNCRKKRYPVFMNMVFAGTPATMDEFFKNHEEDGTAHRFIMTEIPSLGFNKPNMRIPDEKEMTVIYGQIASWREQYCIKQDGNGMDQVVNTTIIDLDYVNDALDGWCEEQSKKSNYKKERAQLYLRMTTIAFHVAIVIHTAYGCPKNDEVMLRRMVVDTTLWVADYCMERYIHEYYIRPREVKKRPRAQTMPEIISLKNRGKSWDEIGEMMGKKPETIRKAVQRYNKRIN